MCCGDACLMELSRHLMNVSAFDSESVSEMRLAAQLADITPDISITLFNKGYYLQGLLHHWQNTRENRHRLLPPRKGRRSMRLSANWGVAMSW